jgi:three-Cys-motif partner protein
MVLPDDDPQKWIYTEHTRFKHELLGKYLSGWTQILGSWNNTICFFDCFAGKGKYKSENNETIYGSPIIALQLAKRKKDKYGKFVFVLIEKNKNNYDDLVQTFKNEGWDNEKILVDFYNDEFHNIADQLLNYFKEKGGRLAPSFFFIDPFGFKGVPFSIVKEILAFPRTEVFFTFMSRDLSRFLSSEKHEYSCTELFGDDCWKEVLDKENREHALVELYMKKLKDDANVEFVLPLRVGADDTRSTTYYLIHASTHFKALELMTNIAYKLSNGRFGFYGPDDNQTILSQFNDPIPGAKEYLLKNFSSSTNYFEDIIKKSYTDEKIFLHSSVIRTAINNMKDEGKIELEGTGPKGGIKPNTVIKFH